jgi:hypothetical protein
MPRDISFAYRLGKAAALLRVWTRQSMAAEWTFAGRR